MKSIMNKVIVVGVSAVIMAAPITAATSTQSAQAATAKKTVSTATVKSAAKVKLPKNTIYIPKLKNKTSINTKYGSVRRGVLQVPNNTQWVRWQSGPKLSATKGTIVMVTHINWGPKRGPLYQHAKMKKGDIVYTYDERGKLRKWKLTSKSMLKKNKLPKQIFTKKGSNRLVMVTCGGKLIKSKSKGNHFDSNVILYFTPTK